MLVPKCCSLIFIRITWHIQCATTSGSITSRAPSLAAAPPPPAVGTALQPFHADSVFLICVLPTSYNHHCVCIMCIPPGTAVAAAYLRALICLGDKASLTRAISALTASSSSAGDIGAMMSWTV